MADLPPDLSEPTRKILALMREFDGLGSKAFFASHPEITPRQVADAFAELFEQDRIRAWTTSPEEGIEDEDERLPELNYRIKATLQGVKPAIWRRFLVSGATRLDKLHDVIQVVMGWDDYHLHRFKIGDAVYSEDFEEGENELDETGFFLDELVKTAGTRFDYWYDFGDGWHVKLVVEKIEKPADEYSIIPICLGGKRRGPLEDSGGPFGYQQLVDAWYAPSKEHAEKLAWAGRKFDPEAFDLNRITLELIKLERWSRGRD